MLQPITPIEFRQLQAYLDDELEGPALDAFEMRLLEHPGLASWVDADNGLRLGLAGLHS